MEENTNNGFFAFDLPKNQSSYIKVIGVGGGGCNAVNHMYREGIHGVDFIVCNTDMKSLNSSPVPNKIALGNLGLGAGNKPEKARKAALDKADEIREAIANNTQMLFITAGMGGGTGTGAAPVIAEIAKSIDLDNQDTKKILVVAIVTKPFSFEGNRRQGQAMEGIDELRKHVDAILVINNDKLRSYKDFVLSKAFGMANDVLLTAAKGIAEIITVDAYVNIDFQDVNTIMENSGTALMGTGMGNGEGRALQAIEQATTSVLLDDNDICGAKNVLLYFSYHPDHEITMDELSEITDYLGDKTNGEADVIWGAGSDESLGEELKVTLIATGFEKTEDEGTVITLESDEKEQPKDSHSRRPQDPHEPFVIQKEPSAEAPKVEAPTDYIPVQPQQPVQPAQPVQPKPAAPQGEKRIFTLDPEPVAQPVRPASSTPQADPMQNIHIVAPAAEAVQGAVAEAQRPAHAVEAAAAAPVQQPVSTVRPAAPQPVRPAAQPSPAAVRDPYIPTLDRNDSRLGDRLVRDTSDRLRRIQQIHDMLRNDPNGGEKAESISLEQVAGATAFEGMHSSAQESSQFVFRPDGSMVKGPGYFENPD